MTEAVPGVELHSIVIPCYNEAEVLPAFYRRVTEALAELPAVELVFVDDGSTDGTRAIIEGLCAEDPRVRLVALARNFGQQTAVTAGIDLAQGDTVTVIDADLQDPPEVIVKLIERWREGADIVFGVRRARIGESTFKRTTASAFYRMLRAFAEVDIPADAGDFRLMSRRAANGLRGMRERSRYIRGLVGWLGLNRAYVEFDRDARVAGETKYPLVKMLRLAADGIVSFSRKPLQMATWMGLGASVIALGFAVWVVWLRLFTDRTVEGWSSVMVALLFLGGVQLVTVGIIGEYVGRIYDEVRNRPLYIVGSVTGFSEPVERRYSESVLPASPAENAQREENV